MSDPLPQMPPSDAPKINADAPYRHLHQDDLQWLHDQLDAVNEKVTDWFASDLDAIPEDLDGINSAYMMVAMEIAWREAYGMGGGETK